MKAWRAAFVALAIVAPVAVLTMMAGCDQGSPARPTSPPIPEAGDGVDLCPKIDPTFESIQLKVLSTNTCGSIRNGCHAVGSNGLSGGIVYETDPATIYEEFLGDAGTGHSIANQAGSVRQDSGLVRVAPGDAGGSFLVIKLMTQTKADPQYGAGMPLDHPGQLCAADIDTIRAWINAGAKFEEDDGGEPSDASSDAPLDASTLDAGDSGD